MTRHDSSTVRADRLSIKSAIQVAGIADEEEAKTLMDCGVDYLGFPLRLAVHEADISESRAVEVVRCIEPPSRPVLITYLDDAREIAEFCRYLGVSIVQLHGAIAPDELAALRTIDPKLRVIKSVVIRDDERPDLDRALADVLPFVDAFITDTFDPGTGASGATGRTHDWAVSRKIVDCSPKPVVVAGGLTPENVRRVICEVRPAGVDVHTGVEDGRGRKDPDLVRAFVSEARAAFATI